MAEPLLIDGAAAVSGSAVFVADRSPKGLLFARARVGAGAVSGLERAARLPGVRAVRSVSGDPGAALAVAADEAAAREALATLTIETATAHASQAEPEPTEQVGEPEAVLQGSTVRTKSLYTLPFSPPSCLEPEAWLVHFGEQPEVWGSAAAGPLDSGFQVYSSVPPGCPRTDRSALLAECARLSRELDAPLRVTIEEPPPAGEPLSAEIDLSLSDKGRLTAWSSVSRGASGMHLPWGLDVAHRLHRDAGGPARAGEAEAGYFTSLALDDAAVALGFGPLEVVQANLPTSGDKERLLKRLLAAADGLMHMSRRWHPRGDAGKGETRRGLGLAIGGTGRGLLAVMADAAVDWDTGHVEVRRLAAASTADPALDAATARALLSEGLVRGVNRALTQGWVASARMGDVGEIEIELVEAAAGATLPEGRVGELVTAAAIGNAVANAVGVRAPQLPLTPRTVLQALARW